MFRRVFLAMFTAGLAVLLGACASPRGGIRTAPPTTADAADFYQEVEHFDRIYVLGSPTSAAAFAETPLLQDYRVFLGAGPDNRTVVIETDRRRPELGARLIAAFESRHGIKLN